MESKIKALLGGQTQLVSPQELQAIQTKLSELKIPLEQFLSINLLLYRQSPDLSYQFLLYVEKQQLSKPCYNDIIYQGSKMTVYNNLMGLSLARAIKESNKEEVEKHISEAKKFLSFSEKVRMTVQKSIILSRAYLLFYGGQITKALHFSQRSYEQIMKTGEGRNLLVTNILMLAQIHFAKKNYQKALELYKKCLATNKKLPTGARLGMGYCFFYLNKFQLARACFQRIIKLDSDCVEAYIALAIIYDKQQSPEDYFRYLQLAYNKNKNHPLVLIHLAEHSLFKKELEKAEIFSKRGLNSIENISKFLRIEQNCRNDYEEYKARFNNILGQVSHIKNNFYEAIKFYSQASGKGLIFNQIALAQVYLHPNSQNFIQAMRLMEDVYRNHDGKNTKLLNEVQKLMAYLKSKIPPKTKQQKNAQFYFLESFKYNRHDLEAKIEYINILVQISKQKALRQINDAISIQKNSGGFLSELQNNQGVLLLENKQIDQAEEVFLASLNHLKGMECSYSENHIRKQALELIIKFNYGICLELQCKSYSALNIYNEIINKNKCYLDTYMRAAYLSLDMGNYELSLNYLERAETICTQYPSKLLKPEKIWILRAYIQHIWGNTLLARETLRMLGKNKDIYVQLFEQCMNYQTLMRKKEDMSRIKEFLRPHRDFCYKYCSEDPNASFGYLQLVISLIIDKKITKKQAYQFFSALKQNCSDELPSSLYNMGLFLLNYDDLEASTTIMRIYKDKVNNSRADQIISLNYSLAGDYKKSIKIIQGNIMRDPANIRHRTQLIYAHQKKCNEDFEDKKCQKLPEFKRNYEILIRIKTFYEFYKHVRLEDFLRVTSSLQIKERIKSTYIQIKGMAQENLMYTNSLIDAFEKKIYEASMRQRENQLAAQQKSLKQKEDEENKKILQQILDDSGDEQEKQKKLKQMKRQKALEFARKRQAQLSSAWADIIQKDKKEEEEKKTKKTAGKKKGQKRQKDVLANANRFAQEEQSEKKSSSSENPEYQQQLLPTKLRNQDSEPIRTREKQKYRKLKDQEDVSSSRIIKKPGGKKQRKYDSESDQQGIDLQKYLL